MPHVGHVVLSGTWLHCSALHSVCCACRRTAEELAVHHLVIASILAAKTRKYSGTYKVGMRELLVRLTVLLHAAYTAYNIHSISIACHQAPMSANLNMQPDHES